MVFFGILAHKCAQPRGVTLGCLPHDKIRPLAETLSRRGDLVSLLQGEQSEERGLKDVFRRGWDGRGHL